MNKSGSFFLGRGLKDAKAVKAQSKRVRQGEVTPMRTVPAGIERPDYADGSDPIEGLENPVKTADVIKRMRIAGRITAEVLNVVGAAVRPGITGEELDIIAHEATIERGAYPSPLNYLGFPKAVCTSVNEVICHGIPDTRPLEDGDIVNIDVSCYAEGVHGDTSRTFLVGDVDEESRRLVDVTRECLRAGIHAVEVGRPVADVGREIQKVADAAGMGVVRAFVGHGIGTEFHSDPQVHHYATNQKQPVWKAGMTFTIEPMITLGSWRHRMVFDDGWTAITSDYSRTAQFEHTMLVTNDGVELLTVADDTPEIDRHGL